MKLRKNFITHRVGEEQLMLDVSGKFNGIVTNNDTAAFIVDCLKEEVSISDIVKKITEEYDVLAERAEKDVITIIKKLREINAIDE